MPASSAFRATRGMGRSSRTPRASRTSAEPDVDDAARLPCLTTLAPAPAADQRGHGGDVHGVLLVPAGADDVQLLARDLDRVGVGDHRLHQAGELRPRSRPWTRRATRNPATWAGVASPDMIEFMAHSVLPAVRSVPLMSAPMSRGQVLPAAGADA